MEFSLKRLEEVANQGAFHFCGVDLWQWIQSWFDGALRPAMGELNAQVQRLATLLMRTPPRLALAQHALGLGGALGELCLQRGIPAMLITHGTHVPPQGCFERIEWFEQGRGLMDAAYPYVALQTPWAQRYIASMGTRWSQPVCTGPLLFTKKIDKEEMGKEELRSRLFPKFQEKRIILQASTPKARFSHRFWVYETIDEYVRNINSLIRVVDKQDGAHLVVRFRPIENFTLDELKGLLVESKCYTIRTDGAFGDFLLASDLLVSYSSTTIEEALQNRIPVLQYDFDGKYCHIPASRFDKGSGSEPKLNSCYYAADEESLVEALRWIVDNHLNDENAEVDWGRHFFHESECDATRLNRLSETN